MLNIPKHVDPNAYNEAVRRLSRPKSAEDVPPPLQKTKMQIELQGFVVRAIAGTLAFITCIILFALLALIVQICWNVILVAAGAPYMSFARALAYTAILSLTFGFATAKGVHERVFSK